MKLVLVNLKNRGNLISADTQAWKIHGRKLVSNSFSIVFQGRKYELVATITHHGRDPSKGHYTTDARHHSGQWLRFDDSSVTVISTSKVLHEQPYVLFYKQV